MTRTTALFLTLAVPLAGCATLSGPRASVRSLDRSLYMADMGKETDFEKSVRKDSRPIEHPNAAPITVAVTGALGAALAATSISFGIAGASMNRKLDQGFDKGLTVAEEDRIRSRGDTFNKITIATGAAAAVSLAAAAVVYGINYTRCGKLAKRRRKCASDVEAE